MRLSSCQNLLWDGDQMTGSQPPSNTCGAAIIELTDEHGRWAGIGRIETRRGDRATLYAEGYRQASLSAQSKGGRLDRFTELTPGS
jgi:hypothetical protein